MSRLLLLAEDNPTDEKLTLRALKKSGLANQVVVVRDGPEVLDFLFGTGAFQGRDVSHLPAVLLLDLNLPRMDGLEVLERIRANERTRPLPVVMLTGSKEAEDIARSYSLHANAFVSKPVDFEHFIDAIRQIDNFFLTLVCLPG